MFSLVLLNAFLFADAQPDGFLFLNGNVRQLSVYDLILDDPTICDNPLPPIPTSIVSPKEDILAQHKLLTLCRLYKSQKKAGVLDLEDESRSAKSGQERELTIQMSNPNAVVIEPKKPTPPTWIDALLNPSVAGPLYVANEALKHAIPGSERKLSVPTFDDILDDPTICDNVSPEEVTLAQHKLLTSCRLYESLKKAGVLYLEYESRSAKNDNERKLTIQPSNLDTVVIKPKPQPPSWFDVLMNPSVAGPLYVVNEALKKVKESVGNGRSLFHKFNFDNTSRLLNQAAAEEIDASNASTTVMI